MARRGHRCDNAQAALALPGHRFNFDSDIFRQARNLHAGARRIRHPVLVKKPGVRLINCRKFIQVLDEDINLANMFEG